MAFGLTRAKDTLVALVNVTVAFEVECGARVSMRVS
jgi:hypothetical protein